MKKVFIIFLILFTGMSSIYAIDVKSNNVIMYNMNDNSIIYEKNAYDKVQIASLTKIVTAITVLNNVEDLNKEIVITSEMIKNLNGYAKLGLKVGDKLTVIDLLYALMLPSSADAAQALAISTSGSVEEFSNLMNNEVKKIGVNDSMFDNPIGKDSENNYSTASDLATILIYSLKNEIFKEIFYAEDYYISSINKKIQKTIVSTSKEYSLNIDLIKGAKTGFTYDAGLCLASVSTINNVDYLLVVLSSPINYPYHIVDTIDLYEYYSSNYDYINVLESNELIDKIKIKGSRQKEYELRSDEDVSLYLEKSTNKNNLKIVYDGIKEINKKIKLGDKLGTVSIYNDSNLIYEYDVYLNEDIRYINYTIYIIIFLLFVVLFIFMLKKKLKTSKNIKQKNYLKN